MEQWSSALSCQSVDTVLDAFSRRKPWLQIIARVSLAASGLSLTLCVHADQSGEQIYHTGALATPYVTLKQQGTQVPSRLFACVNCHGPKGEGKKEGGLVAPGVTWFQLTQNARADADGGRARPPYTRQSLRLALEEGLGSGGQPLSNAMPRYVLLDAEVDALVKYLQLIDQRAAPGLDAYSIRLGVRLPSGGAQAQVIAKTLEAFVQQVNGQGGIYGRHLNLYFLRADEIPPVNKIFLLLDCRLPDDTHKADEYSADLPVFAFFAPSSAAGAEDPMQMTYHFALYDVARFAENALRQFALANDLLIESEFLHEEEAFQTQQSPVTAPDVRRAHIVAAKRVPEWLANTRFSDPAPTLLVAGNGAWIEHPEYASYPGAIFVAGAPTPYQADAVALRRYQGLAQNYDLPKQYLSEQLWTLSLMHVVTETLRAAGKGVLRENFIESVLTQYQFTPHYGPMLRFSARKSVGAMGAAIVPLKTTSGDSPQVQTPWIRVREHP